MSKKLKFYIITKITDLQGNDRKNGRYPLRIGRRCAFRLGFPSKFMKMAVCYRPRREEDYSGTLYTSEVEGVEEKEDKLIVTTQNSIYHFQELEE